MKVSVIIPCFNEVDTVQLLLDSVNEDTSCEKEIIVIVLSMMKINTILLIILKIYITKPHKKSQK